MGDSWETGWKSEGRKAVHLLYAHAEAFIGAFDALEYCRRKGGGVGVPPVTTEKDTRRLKWRHRKWKIDELRLPIVGENGRVTLILTPKGEASEAAGYGLILVG